MKDDNCFYLSNKIIDITKQNELNYNDIYSKGCDKYKNYPNELKKCDSCYNLVKKLSNKIANLDYSKKDEVLKSRDSILVLLNRKYMHFKEDDKLNLNESVFKISIQYEMSNVFLDFLVFNILKPTALKVKEDYE